MRKALLAVCFGSALACGLATQAVAGGYASGPQVIPGIGPDMGSPYVSGPQGQVYDPGAGYVTPGAPQRAPMRVMVRPTPVAPQARNLGGGFLEALVGGGADQDRGNAAATAAPRRAMAYNGVGLQPDPYGSTAYAVRPAKTIDPAFQRQRVAYDGHQPPGTIVIDTTNKFLYLVEEHGQATRYGIGVGRPGFVWAGNKTITRKAEWPDWTPPAEMRLRRPDLPMHMEGGIANPLGARAMYLGSTLYRIHGTNEPETIGTNVSSGCIRLTNDDVTDLYGRVRVGTHVVVM